MHPVNFDFYAHGTIRKIVVAVGTIFNGIKIKRADDSSKLYTVPISYGSKSGWYYRLEDGPENQTSLPVPRLSYFFTGAQRDENRATNRLNVLRYDEVSETAEGKMVRKRSLNQQPWKFQFDFSIYSKNMEDCLQIVEQILPYFSPTINLRILEIPELDHWSDIQISMGGGPSIDDSYEQSFSSRRTILMSIPLEVSGYLYPPVKEQKVITKVITDIDNPLTNYRYDLETITVEANPGELIDKENSTVTIEIDV